MFNLADSWHLWLLVFVIAIVAIIGRYKAKDLKTPEKELCNLRLSIILFGIVAFFALMTQPIFYHHSYIPADFKTLEDAREVIKDLDSDLKEVNENLEDASRGLSLILLALFVGVLPSILNFARAIVPVNPEDNDKDMISIFDRDNDRK